MRNGKLVVLFVAFVAVVIVGCKDDDSDYVYPNVLTNFVELTTNSSGILSNLDTDDGDSYGLTNAYGGFTTDSVYRVVAQYKMESSDNVYLYNTTRTISPNPVYSTHIKGGFIFDPVCVQSISFTPKYLNIVLQIKSNNGVHAFHFGVDTMRTDTEHKLLSMRLYHNSGNDSLYYTRKVYLSVPIKKYSFTTGDTIRMGFNLYSGDTKYYEFVYN